MKKLIELIISDYKRKRAYSNVGFIYFLFFSRSFWAVFQYRIAHAVYISRLPVLLKKPLLIIMVLWQWLIEIFTSITIPYKCKIGKGLYIGHPNNIILNAQSVLGDYCNLSQGVTIGVSGMGENRGVPLIGDYAYIGANATIAGKITLGNECTVGANTLVVKSAEDQSVLLGVPAQVIKIKSSKPYILPIE